MFFQSNLRGINLFLRDLGAYFLVWFAGYVFPMFLIWFLIPTGGTGMRFFSVFVLLPVLFVLLGFLFGRKTLILHLALLIPPALFIWYSFHTYNPMETSASPEDVHFYSGLIGFTLMFLCAPVLKFAVENYGNDFLRGFKSLRLKSSSSKTKRRTAPKRKRKSS